MENLNELLPWVLTALFGVVSSITAKWAIALRSKGNGLLQLLFETTDVVIKGRVLLEKYEEYKEDKKFTKEEVEDIMLAFEEVIKEGEEVKDAFLKLIKKNEDNK
jgi:hypothetical protein